MKRRQKKIKELREKIREYERPVNRLSGFVILDLFSAILDLLEDEGEEKRVDRITRDFLKSSQDLHNAIAPKPKPKKWKPEKDDRYFYIEFPHLKSDIWHNTLFDNNMYEIKNCFKTECLAEKARDEIKKLLAKMPKE